MRSDRRSSGSLYPASTSLLLKVEVPASGFSVLLSFAVKPGSPLEQVQQGITEVIDELSCRLYGFLNEKDLQSNADKYEVAKLECEEQLQDWQSRLSEATLAVLRADRSRSELAKLRESYWREVQNLRSQLYRKQQAEDCGKDFVPASVDLFSREAASSGFNDLLLEQMNRMEDEHKAEIASWKHKNTELLKKMKWKVLGIEMATSDADVQTDLEVKEVSCGTEPVSDTVEFINNFVNVKDLAKVQSVDSEMQTESGEVEDAATSVTYEGDMKARTRSADMTDQSYQDVESDNDSDDSDDSDSEAELENLENFQERCPTEKLQEPIVTETEIDVDSVVVSKSVPSPVEKTHPTLLEVSRTPTSPTSPTSPPCQPTPNRPRFQRPNLQIKTTFEDEKSEKSDRCESRKSPGSQLGKHRIDSMSSISESEKTERRPSRLMTPRPAVRSSSHDSSRTKLPGLRTDENSSRSPPIRRSSVTFEDKLDKSEFTFPVCSAKPPGRTISRPRFSTRRRSTRD